MTPLPHCIRFSPDAGGSLHIRPAAIKRCNRLKNRLERRVRESSVAARA